MVENPKVWYALRDGVIDVGEYYKIMMEIESKANKRYIDGFPTINKAKPNTKGYYKVIRKRRNF